MDKVEIFACLGIEATKDENLIKKAYRSRLSVTNPEDDQEGFKRLRKAYEEACRYARSKDEEEEVVEQPKTLSDLWIDKAEAIYNRFSTRIDIKQWEQLFEEDIFISLDGEEECRIRMLGFIMGHFYYPDYVWKLFGERLAVLENQGKLKEMFPADYIDFFVRKLSEDGTVDYALFEGADDANYDSYINYFNEVWRAVNDKEYKLVSQLLKEVESLKIYHPLMDMVKAIYLIESGEATAGFEIFDYIYKKYSSDKTIAYNYAQMCWEKGNRELGAELFLKLKAEDDEHYMANVYLTDWYVEKGDYKAAKKCAELVMTHGGTDEFYDKMCAINEKLMDEYTAEFEKTRDIETGFELGRCMLQNGLYCKGIKHVEALYPSVDEEKRASYLSLISKLYFDETLYEKCIETTAKWRDIIKHRLKTDEGKDLKDDTIRLIQSYEIRIEAYHQMALAKPEYYDLAMKEIELMEKDVESGIIDEIPIQVSHELAMIHLDMNEPQKALPILEDLVENKKVYGAYVGMLRAYVLLRDAAGVVNVSQACQEYFPRFERGYEEVAKVYHDLNRIADMENLIERAKKNEVQSVFLEAYDYQMKYAVNNDTFRERLDDFEKKYEQKISREKDLKYYEKGYPVVTKLLYEKIGNYMLVERALFSMAALDFDKAKKDLEKVLERSPSDQFALNNLGCIYKYLGEFEKAIVSFRRAIRYMDDEPNAYPYANLAKTYELMGEYELAAQVYDQLIVRFRDEEPDYLYAIIRANVRAGKSNKAYSYAVSKRKDDKYFANSYEFHAGMKEYYMNLGDFEGVETEVNNMAEAFEAFSEEDKNSRRGGMLRAKARFYLEKGMYSEAIDCFKERADFYEKKSGIETLESLEEYLFALSIAKIAADNGVDLFDDGSRTKMAFFKKKRSYSSVNYVASAKQMIELLNKATNRENGNFYLYQEKYAAWVKFIGTFFTGSVEDCEKVLESIEAGRLCRNCVNPFCVERDLAKALLAEKKGDIREAVRIYESIHERLPYDWYSKSKLRYMDRLEKR